MKHRTTRILSLVTTFVMMFAICAVTTCALASVLQLPSGVKRIEEQAFYGDTSLDEVVIPDGVEYIGSEAFAESSATKVTIPDSVNKIADDAFDRAENVRIEAENGTYAYQYALRNDLLDQNLISAMTVGNQTITLQADGSAYVSFTAPADGVYVFESVNADDIGCSLYDAKMHQIDYNSYWDSGDFTLTKAMAQGQKVHLKLSTYADDETTITLRISVRNATEISGSCGENVRWSLSDTTLTISGTGDMVFEEGASWRAEAPWAAYKNEIRHVVITSGVTGIADYAFYDCRVMTDISIPDTVSSIGKDAMHYCSALRSVTLPAGLQTIGDYAFNNCSSLTSISIPKSVSSVGECAFSYCHALKTATVSGSLGDEAYNLFSHCISLTSITISEGVTVLLDDMFYDCPKLTTAHLPASLTTIGAYAFSETGIATVYYAGTMSQWQQVSIMGGNAALYYTADVICCDGTIQAVKGGSFGNISWRVENGTMYFTGTGPIPKEAQIGGITCSMDEMIYYIFSELPFTHIQVGEGITSLPKSCFENLSQIKSVSLPSTLKSIGMQAFAGCRSLKSVNIPAGVTAIEEQTFHGTGLTSIELPAGLKTIGDHAFADCSDLVRVKLPDSITEIGQGAFTLCRNLRDVTLPANLVTIGDSAFYICEQITKITIPGKVETIGDNAFYRCGLTMLVVAEGVTDLSGDDCFDDCDSLREVTLPASVTAIGTYTFPFGQHITYHTVAGSYAAEWASFTDFRFELQEDGTCEITDYCGTDSSLTIPEKILGAAVTKIGGSAFSGSESLTSVVIPNTVTYIGSYAFSSCKGLTSIVVPNSVTQIDTDAFYNCSGLTSITLPFVGASRTADDGENFFGCIFGAWRPSSQNSYLPKDLRTVTITDTKKIGDKAFMGCSGISEIVLPAGLTSIGSYAFDGCSGFTGSLEIPDSVTNIGSYAFSGCSGFTGSLEIPDSVTSIGSDAFYGCSGFTGSLVIPDSVTTIDNYTFSGCSSLTSITIPNSVTSIGQGAFKDCNSLTSVILPFVGSGTTSNTYFGYIFGAYGYYINSNYVPATLETVTITGGTRIDDYAFYYCSSLTSITISDSVTSIGSYAFQGCSGFTGSLVIPDSVTSIGSRAFYGCNGFTGSLEIPDCVTSIGNSAFYGCSGFTGSLEIPDSVTSIGSYAFYGCSGFTGSLVIPDSVTSIGSYAFDGCSGFTGSLEIPDSVTSIDNYTFSGCSSLTSITIPNSVTSIGWCAFEDCNSLTSVTLPFVGSGTTSDTYFGYIFGAQTDYYNSNYVPATLETVTITGGTRIDDFAFHYCSGLTSIKIPDSVTSIGSYAFFGCSGFTGSLEIPDSVTSIGSYAFYGCSGFTGSLEIPDSVTSIDNYTFSGCSSLTSITIPNSVTSIGQGAFKDCNSLTSVILPFVGSGTTSNTYFGYIFGAYGYYINSNYVPATLETVTITGGTRIDDYAFYGCDNLLSITLSHGITNLGYHAFYGCKSLQEIILPSSVTSIDENVFAGVDYQIIHAPEGSFLNQWLVIAQRFIYTINEAERTCCIDSYKGTATSIQIPSDILGYTVTAIGDSAFKANTILTQIIIPDSVTNIGANAFNGCTSLEVIVLPASVNQIGSNAFSGVDKDHIQTVCGSYAAQWLIASDFEYTIDTVNRVVTITGYCGDSENVVVPEKIFGYAVTTIASNAFLNRTELTSIVIAQGVWDIKQNAFNGCTGLTMVNLPESIRSIGTNAFDQVDLSGILVVSGSYAEEWLERMLQGPYLIISGRVVNTVTGAGIQNVQITCGILETTTDASGEYSLELPQGEYTLSYVCDGYITFTQTISITAESNHVYDVAMTESLPVDTYRVVLTWNAYPRDLDSHLINSDGVHVYFGNKSQAQASLDRDVTSGYGPETMTFTAANHCSYAYYVYNYSGDKDISNSDASITIYRGDQIIGTKTVPAGSGRYWEVFRIISGNLVFVDKISIVAPSSDLPVITGMFDEDSYEITTGQTLQLTGTASVRNTTLKRVSIQIHGYNGPDGDEDYVYASVDLSGKDLTSIKLQDYAAFTLDGTCAPLNTPGEYTVKLYAKANDDEETWRLVDSAVVTVEPAESKATADISGSVRLSSGKGLSDITVYLYDSQFKIVSQVTTDRDGCFSWRGLTVGDRYTVCPVCSNNAYQFTTHSFVLSSDGQTVNSVATIVADQDDSISFTMSAVSIEVGDVVTFTVNAPNAVFVKLVVDGVAYDTAYPDSHGDVAFDHKFTQCGIRKIQIMSKNSEGVTSISPEQVLTIQQADDLEPPKIHNIPDLVINESFVVSWDRVNNASEYAVYLFYNGIQQWPRANEKNANITDSLTMQIPASAIPCSGQYSIEVIATAHGYNQMGSSVCVTVYDSKDEVAIINTSSLKNIKLGQMFTVQVSTHNENAYTDLEIIYPVESGMGRATYGLGKGRKYNCTLEMPGTYTLIPYSSVSADTPIDQCAAGQPVTITVAEPAQPVIAYFDTDDHQLYSVLGYTWLEHDKEILFNIDVNFQVAELFLSITNANGTVQQSEKITASDHFDGGHLTIPVSLFSEGRNLVTVTAKYAYGNYDVVKQSKAFPIYLITPVECSGYLKEDTQLLLNPCASKGRVYSAWTNLTVYGYCGELAYVKTQEGVLAFVPTDKISFEMEIYDEWISNAVFAPQASTIIGLQNYFRNSLPLVLNNNSIKQYSLRFAVNEDSIHSVSVSIDYYTKYQYKQTTMEIQANNNGIFVVNWDSLGTEKQFIYNITLTPVAPNGEVCGQAKSIRIVAFTQQDNKTISISSGLLYDYPSYDAPSVMISDDSKATLLGKYDIWDYVCIQNGSKGFVKAKDVRTGTVRGLICISEVYYNQRQSVPGVYRFWLNTFYNNGCRIITGKQNAQMYDLKSGIRALADCTYDCDTTYIYLAGHGSTTEIEIGADQKITHDELFSLLSEIKGNVILFVDSCHSGAMIKWMEKYCDLTRFSCVLNAAQDQFSVGAALQQTLQNWLKNDVYTYYNNDIAEDGMITLYELSTRLSYVHLAGETTFFRLKWCYFDSEASTEFIPSTPENIQYVLANRKVIVDVCAKTVDDPDLKKAIRRQSRFSVDQDGYIVIQVYACNLVYGGNIDGLLFIVPDK